MGEDVVVVVREIAGDDEDVGLELGDAPEDVEEVVVRHARPGMQVGELDEAGAEKRVGQSGHGQFEHDLLGPVRFDLPGVQAHAETGHRSDGAGFEELATSQHPRGLRRGFDRRTTPPEASG